MFADPRKFSLSLSHLIAFDGPQWSHMMISFALLGWSNKGSSLTSWPHLSTALTRVYAPKCLVRSMSQKDCIVSCNAKQSPILKSFWRVYLSTLEIFHCVQFIYCLFQYAEFFELSNKTSCCWWKNGYLKNLPLSIREKYNNNRSQKGFHVFLSCF